MRFDKTHFYGDLLLDKKATRLHGDSGGIRTHATEVTGALNQRLRPLGHTT